jgi:hypothetical protein
MLSSQKASSSEELRPLARRRITTSALCLARATHKQLARVSFPTISHTGSVKRDLLPPPPFCTPPSPLAGESVSRHQARSRAKAANTKAARATQAKAKAAHTMAAHATQAKVFGAPLSSVSPFITVFGTPLSLGTFLVALLILAFALMAALKYTKDADAEGARNPGATRTPPNADSSPADLSQSTRVNARFLRKLAKKPGGGQLMRCAAQSSPARTHVPIPSSMRRSLASLGVSRWGSHAQRVSACKGAQTIGREK